MEAKNLTTVNAYLMFNGNAREAMTFYKGIFGGELHIVDFSQAPMDVPEEAKNKVMHASLLNNHLVLMGSDSMMGEVTHGTTMQLSVNCSSLEEIEHLFSAIAVDGTVTMPLTDQFWGAHFGMVTDKFGFDWMFNYDKPKA